MLRKVLSPLFKPLWLCLLFALVSGCPSPRDASQSQLVPSDWKPSLGQVQTTIQDELDTKAQKGQQYLNRASQNLSDLADAQLFITYTLLIQNLGSKEQKALFEEQKNWLTKRDESAKSAVISKGGSLAPLEYASAFRQVTEKRLAELEERWGQMPNQKNRK